MKKINIILFVLFLATGFKTVNPVASAALKVVDNSVIYDSSYVKLKYPVVMYQPTVVSVLTQKVD